MASLLDLNQIVYATISTQYLKTELTEDLIRHIVLNSIRAQRLKFHSDYGELVICSDSRRYWRRDIFPYYKASRKAIREASGIDWTTIFQAMNNIKAELAETFPYKFMEIEGSEADDIIAVLSKHISEEFGNNEPTVIISGDKDFTQLLSPNIKQWDPINKRWNGQVDVDQFLKEHILKGDFNDGIPNVRSPDNCLVINQRQKPITKKFIEEFDLETCNSEVKRNYFRNKKLIDLSQIPTSLKETILAEYSKEPAGDRGKLFQYFFKHQLKHLTSSIGDF